MKRNNIFQISLFLLPIFESFQFRRDIELKKEKENSVVQSKTIDNQGEEETFPFLGSRVNDEYRFLFPVKEVLNVIVDRTKFRSTRREAIIKCRR